MTEREAVRESFIRISRILGKHSEPEQRRIVSALATLLDYPEATGDQPNG